jgi:dihydrofolate synthase / folylpolyglutamate synthase
MTPPAHHDRDIQPGLERIRALLAGLGHPERRFPAVLIAGTNGKGTCAASLERILREHGVRTGLYTSPHLIHERERVRVDGELVSAEALSDARARVRALAERLALRPSFFEELTAAGFLLLAEAGVERAVVEVGLGGRWDATWPCQADVGLITSIGLDHTGWLGDTLEAIAAEKAAIARPGMTLLSAVAPALHRAVIQPATEALGAAKVRRLDETGFTPGVEDDEPEVHFPDGRDVPVPFAGTHQATNAALAAAAAAELGVAPDIIEAGLRATRWPGRFEVLSEEPLLIVDVAHNPDGLRALAETLRRRYPRERFHVVLGLKPDKDVTRIAPILSAFAWVVHVVDGEGLRPAPELAEALRAAGLRAVARGGVDEATELLRQLQLGDTPVLVCGSHRVVGPVMIAQVLTACVTAVIPLRE